MWLQSRSFDYNDPNVLPTTSPSDSASGGCWTFEFASPVDLVGKKGLYERACVLNTRNVGHHDFWPMNSKHYGLSLSLSVSLFVAMVKSRRGLSIALRACIECKVWLLRFCLLWCVLLGEFRSFNYCFEL